MKSTILPLIIFGVFINTGAQLLLKSGMNRIGHFDFDWSRFFNIGWQIAMNPYILMGLCFYVISLAIWLMVLSRADVSFAYPLISLGYILNAISAYYLLDESLSLPRIAGMLVILFGVFLVAKS